VNGSQRSQHAFVQLGLIGMNGGGVLTEIVETGKGFMAVAWERPFARMFSEAIGSKMSACDQDVSTRLLDTRAQPTSHASPNVRFS
jgi:hypothetical protein